MVNFKSMSVLGDHKFRPQESVHKDIFARNDQTASELDSCCL
jgi:hypothetical protein